MRVIAGSARRLLLKTLPGNDTRPTTDIIKETLFNMINFDLPGCRFLDLYAGTGAIGIEALSRGASFAVFVDNNPKAVEVIKDNLEHTHFTDVSKVITSDSVSAMRRLSGSGVFDIIFMDPPYNMNLEDAALSFLSGSDIFTDGLIIIETSAETDASKYTKYGFKIEKIKEYKTNKHVFLRRSDN